MKTLLSIFVSIILLFVLILYISQNHKSKKMIEDTPLENPTAINNKTSSYKIKAKTLLSSRHKKVDLVRVNFYTRLAMLNAKVGDPIFIRIFKKEAILEVWIKPREEYLLFKQYPICAFSGGLGPKLREGDGQAPEGFYTVKKSQLNPRSKYHLSFNLGYPNRYDRLHHRTGSYLMVHGKCASSGCYAMTDRKIEEIYTLVAHALKHGQKYVQVHAFPFYMTDKNMMKYENSRWYEFWLELKRGYDYFEAEKLPPKIKVENGHYTIYEANQ
jgi:murein L,D-transpeptidase YafK